jgi:phage terminase large subunit-like protein
VPWSDWIVGPNDRAAVQEGCYFDIEKAERVRQFFGHLRHGTGRFRGQPFELLDWQWSKVIAPLFGWRKPDGTRRFRKGYISTPKKNGKTTLLSGLALYLLLADGEPTPEVYSFASERDQAGLVYREAARIIDATPGLARLVKTRDSTKRIIGPDRGFYAAMSAEARSKEGLNASAIIFDELHAQAGRELWDALAYAGSARHQPLHLSITTAGDGSDPQHVCRQEYEYAKKVISGEIIDPTYLGVIYEAGEQDDWEDPATWARANPSFGVTISEDDFRRDYLEAKESPAKVNAFLRYRLNRWVSSASAWLSPDLLDALPADLDVAALQGRPCYCGLDLSATDDLTAAVLLFPPEADNDPFLVLPHFYLPRENIDRLGKKHRVPYRAWERAGLLRLNSGNVVDYHAVRQHIRDLAALYPIKQLGIDRLFQGQSLELDLLDDGLDVVPVGQGWRSQARPLAELERLIRAGRINFGNHPVMRWNLGNVVTRADDAGNLSLSKRLSRSKVDGVAALLSALFCYLNAEGETGGNFYETNPELIVL